MPTTREILEITQRLGLPSAALDYVNHVITSPPSRRVGHTRNESVTVRFSSCKMGLVIQAESRTCEYPFLLRSELDPNCIAFYCQPKAIQVKRRLESGKPHVSKHRFDYLYVEKAAISLVECKTQKELQSLVETRPSSWVFDSTSGRFRCLPYEEAARKLGLTARIFVDTEISPIECGNLSVLKDALRNVPSSVANDIHDDAKGILEREGPVRLSELSRRLRLESPVALIRLVAERRLGAALKIQLLGNPESSYVFADEAAALAYSEEFKTTTTLERALRAHIKVGEAEPDVRTLTFATLSPFQLTESSSRLRTIKPVLAGERAATRNENRWIARLKAGILSGLSCAEAIASRAHLKGNRERRLDDDQIKVATSVIKSYWLSPVQPSMKKAWLAARWPKDAHGKEKAISYGRFCEMCHAVPADKREYERGGYRAAQGVRPATHPANRSVLPTRSWEWAQVDSTPVDAKIIVDLGFDKLFLRVTLYLLLDVFSKFVLAFWICFGGPKRDPLSMLFRDCARRHGKLPNGVLYDHGSEFDSTFNEQFLASMIADKGERPVELPRYAGQVEGSFEVIRQKLLNALAGNMQNDKRGRSASPSYKAHNVTRFIIATMYDEFDKYFFGAFADTPQGKERFSPRQIFTESDQSLGGLATPAPYDLKLLALSGIPTRKQDYHIDPRRGVRVGERAYWNEEFANKNIRKTKALRLEPFDPSTVYAYCGDKWYLCCDSDFQSTRALTEHERFAEAALEFDAKAAIKAIKLEQDRKLARGQMDAWIKQETAESQIAAVNMTSRPTSDAHTGATRTESPFDSARETPIVPLVKRRAV